MYKNRSRGFTLIELLVVIAIIGILSAVVLASLNTARSKGSDAAVTSDLNTIRVQAELYYTNQNPNTYGSVAYGTTCTAGMFSDTTIAQAMTQAKGAISSATQYCFASASQYLVASSLTSGYFCIDSAGQGKVYTGSIPTTNTTGRCP